MANGMIGNHPSHGNQLVHNLDTVVTGNVQLGRADSGKVFMCSQAAAVIVNLPKLSTDIAGWNASFILKTAGSNDFSIFAWGLSAAGTGDSGVTNDGDTIILSKFGSDTDDADSVTAHADSQDGVFFDASVSVIGDRIDVFTDGTNWYCTAFVAQYAHVEDVD
tara:strand:+ start:1401 stop:1889 length:489 start_codon:yes stop_codon:yes gene_type:complete